MANTFLPRLLPRAFPIALLFAAATVVASDDAREAKLAGCARFDFETGTDDQRPRNVGFDIWYDIVFCAGQENEYLRALPKVSWAEPPTRNFALDRSHMVQAEFAARKDAISGYPDLFFNAASGSDALLGKVYWIKTAEGNLVKLRIKSFVPPQKRRGVVRDMVIEYVIYL